MPGAGGARPRRYVVAGAGVLGVCLTARLAGAGAEVMLLEQDQPGQAATRSSFAWLNSNDKAPRAYHELNHAGIRAWDGAGQGPGRRRVVPARGEPRVGGERSRACGAGRAGAQAQRPGGTPPG